MSINGTQTKPESFWGNARDLGVVLVAAVTLIGSADHAAYEAMLRITIGRIDLSASSLLILGVRDLFNALGSCWRALARFWEAEVILLAIALIVLSRFPTFRKSSAAILGEAWIRWRPAFQLKTIQILLALAGFAAAFLIGWRAGIYRALQPSEGNNSEITLIRLKGSPPPGYPSWLVKPDGKHAVSIVMETPDAVYVFSQIPQNVLPSSNGYLEYPAGQLTEIPRDQINDIDTVIRGVEVRHSR